MRVVLQRSGPAAGLRLWEDEDGKMNRSIDEAGGHILSVSQFTLYADTKKGRRPSFIEAARPEQAEPLWNYFNRKLEAAGLTVQTGIFGAMMDVELINDGPVTIIVESK
jgi:D-tyrosyl-tRNA(Tyr) deacylase